MKVTVKSITIHCSKLDKDVTIDCSNRAFTVYTSDGCESCGYGNGADLELENLCECGEAHTIELRS